MKEGFQKIHFSAVHPKNTSNPKTKRQIPFNKIGLLSGTIFLVILGLIIAVAIPAKDIYSALQKTQYSAKGAYEAAKNQNINAASSGLKELEVDLVILQGHVEKLSWLGVIPWIGNYQKDALSGVIAGLASVQAASIAVNTLTPYADLLGLKGESTFVSGSADERIKTAVETIDKIIPSVDLIGEKLKIAEQELEKIDYERYPEKIGNTPLRERIKLAKTLFSETALLFVEAQPLLKRSPELLGNKEPKRYLVLFQNDAELRATGGFITAYGLFKVDKGKIQVERSEDIYKLDEAKQKKYPAPNPILKYHKNVFTLELRDNNLSPDYVISMKDFESMLRESIPDFPTFDGIIALDTHVLVNTVKILGEFNIYGRVFSAEIDDRCDCPKVIYELEDYATRPVAYVRGERKDIIGALLYQIMQKALGVSPSQYWGKLSQMFLEETKQKHVLFYFHDSEAQKGIEALNFAGRIMPSDGDYLHINDVNFAGAKSNLFVRHFVKQEIDVSADGTVTKTITISYKNPSPPSNCNLEAGQLCLNGILRNWLRLYVPEGSVLVEFKGSEKDTVTYNELGKTVFEGFFTVKPQGTAETIVKYTLPQKVKKSDAYKLLIQKQPGTDAFEYTVVKQGKQVEKFQLLTDRYFTFN